MPYGPMEEPPLGVPDEGPLEQIAIDAPVSAQPDWVRELVGETPHEHELRSVRTAEHKGRHIEIVTSYEISIDGQPVHFHASVGDDGLLRCHESPYAQLPSAVDLVKHLIDLYPEAFGGEDGAHASHDEGHDHADHGHDHDDHKRS
jgi:hypothetical protein